MIHNRTNYCSISLQLPNKNTRFLSPHNRLLKFLTILSATLLSSVSFASEPTAGTFEMENHLGKKFEAITLSTDVEISVSGLTARVKVKQKFENNHDQWMEGQYLFPLPDKAAVDHLAMKIGDRVIIGEIKEKQQAKKIYEKAKLTGKKASLVEQNRPNIFTNSVANIAPYETIEVTIEYQQDVIYDRKEGFSIRYPMTITPRYSPFNPTVVLTESFSSANNIKSAHSDFFSNNNILSVLSSTDVDSPLQQNTAFVSVSLDSGVTLQKIESPSHTIINNQLSERKYAINLKHQTVPADRDFILKWKPIASVEPRASIFSERKAGENYLSLMLMPPSISKEPTNKISREIIFIIDTSGSMGGESMRQAKKALSYGLSTLSPDDYFNIIQFNSSSEKLFKASRSVNASNLQTGNNYVKSLSANGGTEMFSAIEMALDMPSEDIEKLAATPLRQIVFLTDGAVSNEAQLFQLIDNRLDDSRLYTVGIGSAPNEFFMKKAARFGRGTFTFIADIQQSREKIQSLFDKISAPQLTHISIVWPPHTEVESWPQKIPDLYDGQPLWIKAKINRRAGDINISGRLGSTFWQGNMSLDKAVSRVNKQRSGIAGLWAREKIASIINSAYHGQVNDEQKRQIIDTAIEHHLVSRFTSLVAVDKTPSRLAEQLHQQKIKNAIPKGFKPNKANTHLSFASTGLDLDIELNQSLWLLLFSFFMLLFYKKYLV